MSRLIFFSALLLFVFQEFIRCDLWNMLLLWQHFLSSMFYIMWWVTVTFSSLLLFVDTTTRDNDTYFVKNVLAPF